jgi:hypothetical protein
MRLDPPLWIDDLLLLTILYSGFFGGYFFRDKDVTSNARGAEAIANESIEAMEMEMETEMEMQVPGNGQVGAPTTTSSTLSREEKKKAQHTFLEG